MKINIKVFYKLVVLLLLVIARYIKNTQNSKFLLSQKRKEEWSRFFVQTNITIIHNLILYFLIGVARHA